MKKLFVLFVFAVSASFVSCSSDDDNGASNEDLIVGKWEFSQEGAVVNGQEILVPYEHEAPECGKDFIEFMTNNTVREVEFYLDFNDECVTDSYDYVYSISGNNLTVTSDGETGVLEILTLNNNTLKFKITEEFGGETLELISVLTKI